MIAVWNAYWQAKQGSMSVLMAGISVFLIALFAFSIDIGLAYTTKAKLQGALDRAALKAVTDADQATILVQQAVDDAFDEDNSVDFTITEGRYPPEGYTLQTATALDPEDRFVATSILPNAVLVEADSPSPAYLSRIFSSEGLSVRASAIAMNTPVAQLLAGTQIFSTDPVENTILNPLMSAYMGTPFALNAGEYDDLLNGSVDVFRLLDELIIITGGKEGDYEAVLTAPVSIVEILNATSNALIGDPLVSGSLTDLEAVIDTARPQLSGLDPITLDSFLELDPEYPSNGRGARLDILSLLSASAQSYNNQENITASQSFSYGGVSMMLWASVIETPRISMIGGVGTTVTTAQSRLYVETTVSDALTLPVLGGLVDVTVPLYIEQGRGTAVIDGLNCPDPTLTSASVEVGATPGVIDLTVGEIDPADMHDANPDTNDATLIDALGSTVVVTSYAEAGLAGASEDLFFTEPFTAENYQVVELSAPFDTTLDTTLSTLEYDITLIGFLPLTENLILADLPALIDGVLNSLTPLLNTAVGSIQSANGLDQGYMKVAVPFLRCSNPRLVN